MNREELIKIASTYGEYIANNSKQLNADSKLQYYLCGSLATMIYGSATELSYCKVIDNSIVQIDDSVAIPQGTRNSLEFFARPIGDLDVLNLAGHMMDNSEKIMKSNGDMASKLNPRTTTEQIPNIGKIFKKGRVEFNEDVRYGLDNSANNHRVCRIKTDNGIDIYVASPETIIAHKLEEIINMLGAGKINKTILFNKETYIKDIKDLITSIDGFSRIYKDNELSDRVAESLLEKTSNSHFREYKKYLPKLLEVICRDMNTIVSLEGWENNISIENVSTVLESSVEKGIEQLSDKNNTIVTENSTNRKFNVQGLLEKGILIGGIVTRNPEGYIIFERVNNIQELLEKKEIGLEIGFATKTMGRSIFIINENGEIENYKGVDSQLGENENALTRRTGTNVAKIPNPIYEGHHQIVLKSSLKEKGIRDYEVRFMGTSPLEDLEIEADVNSKLKKFGIRVPRILSVKEFSPKVASKLGLPTTIKGDYEELRSKSKDAEEDKKRKENLKTIGIDYYDALKEGERPELLIDYFERLGLLEDKRFEEFINNERNLRKDDSIGILNFIKGIDSSYSLGQRHGQATRIVGSPFRISDLEELVEENNIESIKEILQFLHDTIPECSGGNCSVEELFAKQMGTNMALLINNGWCLENLVHRQDYNLAGEMCDDSYINMKAKFAALDKEPEKGKREALVEEYKNIFLGQIHFIASNVNVLEQEMRLRGIGENEISGLIDLYSKSFIETLDIEKVSKSMDWEVEDTKEEFINYFDTSKDSYTYDSTNLPEDYIVDNKNRRDYVLELASKNRGKRGIVYDYAILLASQGNQDFYRKISEKCLEYFKQKNKVKDKEELPIVEERKELTLKDIGQGTTRDFVSNPEQASKVFETLEIGVRTQEEIKEGQTQGEE